jgi:serine/threonine protein kinase
MQLLGVCANPPALVLEYMQNGSLWDYIQSNGVLPMEKTNKIILGIARGMLHLVIPFLDYRF